MGADFWVRVVGDILAVFDECGSRDYVGGGGVEFAADQILIDKTNAVSSRPASTATRRYQTSDGGMLYDSETMSPPTRFLCTLQPQQTVKQIPQDLMSCCYIGHGFLVGDATAAFAAQKFCEI